MYDIWQIPCLLFSHLRSGLGNTSYKENHFLLGIAICQADCDDVWSDNCDYNFGTFDDFGVKNGQKVSHNMILMSRYRDSYMVEKGPKNSGKALPQFSDNAQKKTGFSYVRCSLLEYWPHPLG